MLGLLAAACSSIKRASDSNAAALTPALLAPITPLCSGARQRHQERREAEGLGPDDGSEATTWRGTEAEASELMVYHTSILRNKRLIFAYVYASWPPAPAPPAAAARGGRRRARASSRAPL